MCGLPIIKNSPGLASNWPKSYILILYTRSLLRRGRKEGEQSCRDWSSRIALQKYSLEIRVRYPYGDVKFYLAYRAGMVTKKTLKINNT